MAFQFISDSEAVEELKNKFYDIDKAIKDFYVYNKGDLSIYSTMSLDRFTKYEEMLNTIETTGFIKIDNCFYQEIDCRLRDILTYDEFRYIQFLTIFGARYLFRYSSEQIADVLKYSKKEVNNIHRSVYIKIGKDKRIKQIIRISNRDTSEDLDYELTKSINSMDISERSYNVLRKAGIKYIYDVSKMSISEIRKLKGAGNKTVQEIVQYMDNYGYPLKKWKK